jgi:hypothetical protein
VGGPPHRYRAHGLRIASELELPELSPGDPEDPAVDLQIRLGTVDPAPAGDDRWAHTDADPERVLMAYAEVARLAVRAGREIVVEPLPGEWSDTAHLYVTGSGLAMALAQRGALVLHASAVEVGGHAVAFAADAGYGKSTLAAALHARGHGLVSDDVVAVVFEDGVPTTWPAYPQLKLDPAAATRVGLDPGGLPELYRGSRKRVQRLREGFADRPLVLGAVFVLDEGEEPAVESVPGSEAAVELVRLSYDLPVTHRFAAASNLSLAGRLADSVAVRRLRRPWRLDSLQATADLVLAAVRDAAQAPV